MSKHSFRHRGAEGNKINSSVLRQLTFLYGRQIDKTQSKKCQLEWRRSHPQGPGRRTFQAERRTSAKVLRKNEL